NGAGPPGRTPGAGRGERGGKRQLPTPRPGLRGLPLRDRSPQGNRAHLEKRELGRRQHRVGPSTVARRASEGRTSSLAGASGYGGETTSEHKGGEAWQTNGSTPSGACTTICVSASQTATTSPAP